MNSKIKFAVTAVCLAGVMLTSIETAYSANTNTSVIRAQSVFSDAKVTFKEAEEISLAKTGGGVIKKIEIDYERGVLVYEVEVLYDGTQYEIYVDAQTGEIVKYELEYSRNSVTNAIDKPVSQSSAKSNMRNKAKKSSDNLNEAVKISYERAKEIALAKSGGGTVKEIELDSEKGRRIYEVEIKYKGTEYDVEIDATTGEVIKFKIDD